MAERMIIPTTFKSPMWSLISVLKVSTEIRLTRRYFDMDKN